MPESASREGGLDLIPLNFPLGCGPGSDPPQFPPWVWVWICSPQFPPWLWAWRVVPPSWGWGVSLAGGASFLVGGGGLLPGGSHCQGDLLAGGSPSRGVLLPGRGFSFWGVPPSWGASFWGAGGLLPGGILLPGVVPPSWGASFWGGLFPGGFPCQGAVVLSQHALRQTPPCEQNDKQV